MTSEGMTLDNFLSFSNLTIRGNDHKMLAMQKITTQELRRPPGEIPHGHSIIRPLGCYDKIKDVGQ